MSTIQTKGQTTKAFDLQRVGIRVSKTPGKRNLAPENGDSLPSIDDKVDEEAKKTRHTFLDNMDALAYGVQARFEENTGYSRRVTETTVDIARELRIPQDEIERWAASRLARLIRDTENLNVIKSRLERLQRSFLDCADNKRHSRRAIRSDTT